MPMLVQVPNDTASNLLRSRMRNGIFSALGNAFLGRVKTVPQSNPFSQ